MARSLTSPFVTIRCADLRTRWRFGADVVRASVPNRCLSRHTHLGKQIHVRLRSFADDGSDYMPDPPETFRISRR